MDSRAVAVVSGRTVTRYDGDYHQARLTAPHTDTLSLETPYMADLGQLAYWADVTNVRAVWLLDGQELAATGKAEWWTVERPRHAATSAPQGSEIPTIARVQRHYTDKARPVYVYDLGGRRRGKHTYHDTRWPWWHLTDPDAVAAEVAATERALKRPLGTSPGAMGLELITETNRKHPEWLTYHTLDSPPPMREHAPQWCEWPMLGPHYTDERTGEKVRHDLGSRDLDSADALTGWWLHLIDTNAAYLAAAQSTPLGTGELAHHDGPVYADAPGIYHVTGNLRGPVITRAGWYDLATVRAAVLMGQPVAEPDEAWVWRAHHATLRSWSETLWQARERADGMAREAVKSMYTASIGLMGSTLLRDHSAWYRPLWQAAIVAEAGRRQWYRVHQLRAAGVAVCYLDVDTIGYLLPTQYLPDRSEIDGLGLLGGGLGKYKYAGTHEVTPALARALAGGNVSAVKRLLGKEGQGDG